MALKKLSQFVKFDWQGFSKDKKFIVTACKAWKDYDTDKVLGTAVEVVIAQDNTAYQQKDGESISNLFEKLTFKVARDISIPVNTQVMPVEVIASVYGDYRNMLSCRCKDIQRVSAQPQR